jgi:tRNA (guanine37-N1)-methyltransferase
MTFHIITLFPDAFSSYLNESILRRAQENKKISVKFYDPKDFGPKETKRRKLTYAERRVDDKPYGGGPGMVMEALPVIKAIDKAVKNAKGKVHIIWLTPSGKQFDTAAAQKFSAAAHLIIVCGRYEGIDARVKKAFKTVDISVGPYVLTGGELPAMLIMDSVARQVPGVLGNFASREESRTASPDVYTRPEVLEWKGKKLRVPKILLSGDHAKIEAWKQGKLGDAEGKPTPRSSKRV